MINKVELICSIVLYENDFLEIKELCDSLLKIELNVRIILVDNSVKDNLKKLANDPRVTYIFLGRNVGYGKGHNLAINESIDSGKYHLILNPDVNFTEGSIEAIYQYMELNPMIGQLMPKIYYRDGKLQRLCKLLPTPYDLIIRRFFKKSNWAKSVNDKYELNGFNYDKIIDTPSLSGCFMFLRNDVLKTVGGFDPRFFMYLEDFDLTRRMNEVSRTVFYPYVSITHGYDKGSYSNPKLLFYHIVSAIKYFNKWGWIFDNKRKILNANVINQIYTKQ